jgi:hypothetical protein
MSREQRKTNSVRTNTSQIRLVLFNNKSTNKTQK